MTNESATDHRVYSSEFEYGAMYNGSKEIPGEFWDHLPNDLSKEFPTRMKPNGSRIYPDLGHVEYAAAETATLDDFVHVDLAGEKIMVDTLSTLANTNQSSFRIQKRAVDSSGHHYGSHLNFNVLSSVAFVGVTPAEAERNIQSLAALYVARMALVGGGYFDMENKQWFVSQRVKCFNVLSSSQCHRSPRPLVDTRHEPYANSQYRRLHDSSSDPNISIWSLRTKVGFTSAYLRLLENGQDMEQFYLAEPLKAAHVVGRDTSLRKKIELEDGAETTALYLLENMATAILAYHDKGGFVPDDEIEVTKDVLDTVTKAGDDLSVLGYKSDWYTRMQTAELVADRRAQTSAQRLGVYATVDLQYDTIAVKKRQSGEVVHGHNMNFRRLGRFGKYSQDAVDDMIDNPPRNTRALIRGRLLQASLTDEVRCLYGDIELCNWNRVKFRNLHQPFDLNEPRSIATDEIMRRIFKAADMAVPAETEEAA